MQRNLQHSQWSKGKTLTNGCCGYHAMAEAFTRVTRNRPDLLNGAFFNRENALFRPVQDFLCHSLGIVGSLTAENLQSALSTNEARHNGGFIARNVAPAMLLLAMTHYRLAVRPARDALAHATRDNQLTADERQNVAETLTQKSLVEASPFADDFNDYLERDHYLQYLRTWIYDGSDESVSFDALGNDRLYPILAPIMNGGAISAQTSQELSQQVTGPGLSNYMHFPTMSVFDNLSRLIFRPLAIAPATGLGGGAIDVIYPVSVNTEAELNEYDDNGTPVIDDEVITSIYRCARGAHFEYAISPSAQLFYGEHASEFYPTDLAARRAAQVKVPVILSRKKAQSSGLLRQKQALSRLRSERHKKYERDKASAQTKSCSVKLASPPSGATAAIVTIDSLNEDLHSLKGQLAQLDTRITQAKAPKKKHQRREDLKTLLNSKRQVQQRVNQIQSIVDEQEQLCKASAKGVPQRALQDAPLLSAELAEEKCRLERSIAATSRMRRLDPRSRRDLQQMRQRLAAINDKQHDMSTAIAPSAHFLPEKKEQHLNEALAQSHHNEDVSNGIRVMIASLVNTVCQYQIGALLLLSCYALNQYGSNNVNFERQGGPIPASRDNERVIQLIEPESEGEDENEEVLERFSQASQSPKRR